MGNFVLTPIDENIQKLHEFTKCRHKDLKEAISYWKNDMDARSLLEKEHFDEVAYLSAREKH